MGDKLNDHDAENFIEWYLGKDIKEKLINMEKNLDKRYRFLAFIYCFLGLYCFFFDALRWKFVENANLDGALKILMITLSYLFVYECCVRNHIINLNKKHSINGNNPKFHMTLFFTSKKYYIKIHKKIIIKKLQNTKTHKKNTLFTNLEMLIEYLEAQGGLKRKDTISYTIPLFTSFILGYFITPTFDFTVFVNLSALLFVVIPIISNLHKSSSKNHRKTDLYYYLKLIKSTV